MDRAAAYEARYEVTAGTITILAVNAILALGGLGFVLASRLDEGMADATGGLLGVLVLSVMAGVGLALAAATVRWFAAIRQRRLAVRVDEDGITLGAVPFPPENRTFVPWSDIDRVVLFTFRAHRGLNRPVVGVLLRRTADRPRSALKSIAEFGTNRRQVDASRVVWGWRLDRAALVGAVRAHGRPARLEDRRTHHGRW
jgi:hypothetical protein